MSTTGRFAEFIADPELKWPQEALTEAKWAFLDTIGCIMAGAGHEATLNVINTVSSFGEGPATVIGHPELLPSPWASMINGTAAHAIDYDDVLEPPLTHASAVLVPAILALSEKCGASGEDCLNAYIVGIEVMARLGEALNLYHYHRGWHTTSTIGTVPAAASCAHLLSLNAHKTTMALSISTSLCGGSRRQMGSTAKPWHAGMAAQNGVMAALLADNGMNGSAEVFEGMWGFQDLYAGPEAQGFETPLKKLGKPAAIIEYGIWQKVYPCCASTFRSLDALFQIIKAEQFKADEVLAVEALVPEVALNNLRFYCPVNEAEARFSLHYCLAAALLDGKINMNSFNEEMVNRIEIKKMLPLITMKINPDLPGASGITGGNEPTIVTLTLKKGQTISRTVSYPRGHPRLPLSDTEKRSKFFQCGEKLFCHEKLEEVLLAVINMAELPDIRGLTGLLGVSAA